MPTQSRPFGVGYSERESQVNINLADRGRRDDMALRIRHTHPYWRVIALSRAETYAGTVYRVPILLIWPDRNDTRPGSAIIVRYLWNVARVEARSIGYLRVPVSIVAEGIWPTIEDCAERVLRAVKRDEKRDAAPVSSRTA